MPAKGEGSPTNAYTFDTAISEMGGELNITFDVTFLGSDLKLNADAPQKWTLNLSTSKWIAETTTGDLTSPVSIKVCEGSGMHEVHLTLDIVACKTTECVPKKLSIVYQVYQKAEAVRVVTERRQVVVK